MLARSTHPGRMPSVCAPSECLVRVLLVRAQRACPECPSARRESVPRARCARSSCLPRVRADFGLPPLLTARPYSTTARPYTTEDRNGNELGILEPGAAIGEVAMLGVIDARLSTLRALTEVRCGKRRGCELRGIARGIARERREVVSGDRPKCRAVPVRRVLSISAAPMVCTTVVFHCTPSVRYKQYYRVAPVHETNNVRVVPECSSSAAAL